MYTAIITNDKSIIKPIVMNRMNMTSMLLAAALAIVAALPAEAKKKKQQAPKPPKSAYQKLMDK